MINGFARYRVVDIVQAKNPLEDTTWHSAFVVIAVGDQGRC